MVSDFSYGVVGWYIERDDNSKECVLGTLTDDTYIGEGDDANALVVIRKGSIPTLFDKIKDLQEQLEQKDAALFIMEKGKYGRDYYAGELQVQTDHKITAMQHRDLLQEQLEQTSKNYKRLENVIIKQREQLEQKDKLLQNQIEFKEKALKQRENLKTRNEKLEKAICIHARENLGHIDFEGDEEAINYFTELNEDQRIKESDCE